jgi:hypothetical protein
MEENNVKVGDRVHARFYVHETGNVAIQEFIVSAIEGSLYLGGALPCDIEEGWTVELIEKSPENLDLPNTISEITAYDLNGFTQHLIGKEQNWMTPSGEKYPVRQISKWVPGHL